MADGSVDVERYESAAGVQSDPNLLEALFADTDPASARSSPEPQPPSPPPEPGSPHARPPHIRSGWADPGSTPAMPAWLCSISRRPRLVQARPVRSGGRVAPLPDWRARGNQAVFTPDLPKFRKCVNGDHLVPPAAAK